MIMKQPESLILPNPITQVAGISYNLYQSNQGHYFVGYTDTLTFGMGRAAWAGLYNPPGSGVKLFVYYWEVTNTGPSPIRIQVWFNSNPPGSPVRVTTVTPTNTAIIPLPRPRIEMSQASNTFGEPTGGVKAFVRRANTGVSVGDVEEGKFIFGEEGSFLLHLSNPESPRQAAMAKVGLGWFEEAICQ